MHRALAIVESAVRAVCSLSRCIVFDEEVGVLHVCGVKVDCGAFELCLVCSDIDEEGSIVVINIVDL